MPPDGRHSRLLCGPVGTAGATSKCVCISAEGSWAVMAQSRGQGLTEPPGQQAGTARIPPGACKGKEPHPCPAKALRGDLRLGAKQAPASALGDAPGWQAPQRAAATDLLLGRPRRRPWPRLAAPPLEAAPLRRRQRTRWRRAPASRPRDRAPYSF